MALTDLSSSSAVRLPKPAVTEVANRATIKAPTVAAVNVLGKDTFTAPVRQNSMVSHAEFFDTNFDRKVSIAETRQGLQDLGVGKGASYVLAPLTNVVLGGALHPKPGATTSDKLQNAFSVDLDGLIASAKAEAGATPFDPAKKVARLMAFDTGNTGSLSLAEINTWIAADVPGSLAQTRTKLGFSQLVGLAADTQKVVVEKGVQKTVPALSRARLDSFYKGTIFYDIAAHRGHPHALPPG
jgi:hypothetical protein